MPSFPAPQLAHRQPVWDEERLCFDTGTFFKALLLDLATAQEEILLETYIFALDTSGKAVLAALQQAAARGVRVRVLIDGVGSSDTAHTIAESLQGGDSEVRIHHPLPWKLPTLRWTLRRRGLLSRIWHSLTRLNHRNHRKLCLIDRHIAWVGSFNITEGNSPDHPTPRHETGARLRGSDVETLRQHFFYIWQQRERNIRKRLRHLLSNHTHTLRKHKNRELVQHLDAAQKRIWISNAYFSPSPTLLAALNHAVKRGIDVTLLVPSRSDIHFFPSLSRTFYADLLAAGLKIYEYHNGILHSKTLLIDDQLIVGSTNLNYRSFFHDLELDVILSRPETLQQMAQKFLGDLSQGEQITSLRLTQFPWTAHLIGWLSRLLRYWF